MSPRQRMNRCPQCEGQRWMSFCSNLKSPWFGVGRFKTDYQTDSSSVAYVPASSTWLSLPIGGFLCSSPSPALKHHGGFNYPACKKYCEEEEDMERRSKTITKCLALWKKNNKNLTNTSCSVWPHTHTQKTT